MCYTVCKHHGAQTSFYIIVPFRSSHLQHNRINASKFSFFSVEIFNGTLQQKNFGVFNTRIHLQKHKQSVKAFKVCTLQAFNHNFKSILFLIPLKQIISCICIKVLSFSYFVAFVYIFSRQTSQFKAMQYSSKTDCFINAILIQPYVILTIFFISNTAIRAINGEELPRGKSSFKTVI